MIKVRRSLIGSAALLTLPLRSTAGQVENVLPTDVFHLEYPFDPQISPDGQWIVYVRQYADIMTDRRYSNLWLVRPDGSQHRPLTTGRFNDTSPRWSPDGKRLAFISNRDGTSQIHVHWMEVGQTSPITRLGETPSGIAWSPDGSRIAFFKLAPSRPLVIGPLPAAPSGAQWAVPPKYTNRLVFRVDGQGDVPPGYGHLFVVPSEGGAARQITSGDFMHGGVGAPDPVWSPDGTSLILAARRRQDAELYPSDSDLFQVSTSDGTIVRLTDQQGPDHSPAVSPDGRLLAYVGFADRKLGYQTARLFLMKRDGSGKRLLSAGLDQSVSSPRWEANGSAIYAMYDELGNSRVARFAVDGTFQEVAHDLGSGGANYGGGSFSVAKDGSIAFVFSTANVPGDVGIVSAQGAQRAVTNLNNSLLQTRRLGQVEEMWYSSSIDGRRIQGWIVKPPAFDSTRKYPLILEIHGGPYGNYGRRFDFEKQAMAARGFVVLYTNPRGSTSYGEEFANLIQHAFPGDDYHDLSSGVDAVLAKGYVNPAALYVAGGSAGGTLTSWIIGRTTRFRAAVAFAPVSSWYSLTLTTDVGVATINNYFAVFPWDDVERYHLRSPLSLVKNVKTPVLIMTGEEDYRTPMSEAEQYYKALKILGREAVLARVPGERHSLMNRPSHTAAKVATLLAWFELHGANHTP